jgi:IMP dehydrogenase/GMP reductase
MKAHNSKIIGEGLTYDDVLLVPNYSSVLPREVSIQSKFSRNITLNVPIVSAAMDTVTESAMAIAMAQEGGIGVLHKNMTIEQQAAKVRKVKRAESGMIIDPVTLPLTSTVADAKMAMKEYGIGGIPIVDENKILKGIVTNRDLRFEKNTSRAIVEVMTKDNLITVAEGTSLEQDPEKENGVIINDFFLDGMDLKISFNTQKPLEPKVEMETQVVTKLSEVTGGAVLGTDMILAVPYTGVVSYFNVCQGFALLYHTFYVEGYESAGPLGTYPTIVEWISKEEYDYLKKQGY